MRTISTTLAVLLSLAVFCGYTLSAKEPELIPRAVFFGNPERTSPQPSPDGKLLAYLAPDRKNVLQVWLRTVGEKDDRPLTQDKRRGIRQYFWAHDGRHLLYEQDTDGDENFHLHSADLKSGQVRDLTPFQGVRAENVDLSPEFPEEVLVGLNLEDRKKFDTYRVNLRTGATVLDPENPGTVVRGGPVTDFQRRAPGVAGKQDERRDLP
jgi:Tol biopolymer transport system component